MRKSTKLLLASILNLWFSSWVLFTFTSDEPRWWVFPFAVTALLAFAATLTGTCIAWEDGE